MVGFFGISIYLACVCICMHASVSRHMCASQGITYKLLVLSFYHAGLGDWIEIIRLGSRFLHMLSHLSHPCLLTLTQAFSMANRASGPVEIKLKWLSHLLMSEWLWTTHFNCLYSCFHLWNKSRNRLSAHCPQWKFYETIDKSLWNLPHLSEGTGQICLSTHWVWLRELDKTADCYSFFQGTPSSSLSISDHSLHPLLRREDTG